jgi:cytochrome c biogenesis protein CcmG, thiol:disulfide interchange protein DsbE
MENVEEKVQPARRGLPLWVTIVAFVALLGFLTVIGLGLKRAQSGPIVIGQKVPEITLTTFDGETIKSSDLAGKVIVLNFWASWCKPCEQEAAELEQAWQIYKPGGKVVFLGADYVDTEPEARGYLKKFGITYQNGPDLGTKISQMFRIRGVPETYVINPKGELTYVKIGPFESVDEIKSVLDGLLAQ